MPFNQMSLIYREAWFPPLFVKQNQPNFFVFFLFGDLRPLSKKISNLRPLFSITFPQGFWVSKKYWTSDFGKWGGKKTFKRYLKSEQTDIRTDTQTDGQMLWKLPWIMIYDLSMYPKSIPKLSRMYLKSIPKVFQKYPKSIPKLSQNYPKSMLYIFFLYLLYFILPSVLSVHSVLSILSVFSVVSAFSVFL